MKNGRPGDGARRRAGFRAFPRLDERGRAPRMRPLGATLRCDLEGGLGRDLPCARRDGDLRFPVFRKHAVQAFAHQGEDGGPSFGREDLELIAHLRSKVYGDRLGLSYGRRGRQPSHLRAVSGFVQSDGEVGFLRHGATLLSV